jgi:hypothetical protein
MERLTRRNLLGAAGALAGGSTLAGAAAAMPALKTTAGAGVDAELCFLLAEEERCWGIISELQDEAQRRKEAISLGRVEIGQSITKGKVEPIYATSEDDLASWFDAGEGYSPEQLQLRADINRALGRTVVLYHDRRGDLLSQIQLETAAREAALRAARVDELNAQAETYIKQVGDLSDRIDSIQPRTIEGAIALLRDGMSNREEQAIAGLRAIASGGAA